MPQMIPVVNHSLKYNPSLDGIRGIAIISVLLFHIWPKYFHYGYLGVDLFFLLSGYLITQIIYKKLQNDSFSFKEFYRNRIRRIFPAVIIVLLFTSLIGWLFLFPSELENLGKHIKSSALFYENFRLIDEVSYWDKAAQLKPLLHFWSLSVEEQFYIIWPLIIFISYRLKWNLLLVLTSLLIGTYLLQYVIEIDKFYHSLARFWELVLGGVLYIVSDKYRVSISSTSRLLSFYPLVFIGLISFPLYLWHYVIISYMHVFDINVRDYGFSIIFISIILAFLTYRFVELYTRKQNSYLFAFFLFITLVLVGFLGQYIYKNKGLPNRTHLEKNDKFAKQFIREPIKNREGIVLVTKILGYTPLNDYVKATSSDLSKKYVLVMGDSHAHTSYPGFAQEFKKKGYETLLVANSSCPPYIEGAMGKSIKDIEKCQVKIDDMYNIVNNLKNINKIVFVTRGPVYMYDLGYGVVDSGGKALNYHFQGFFENRNTYNQENTFFKVLETSLKYFDQRGLEFYYLIENPELGFSPKNCMIRPYGIVSSDCKLSIEEYLNRASSYRDFIYRIVKKYPKIKLLDPKKLYCDKKYCYAIKNKKMLYADDDHHSLDGSHEQAKYFEKKIFNAN